MHGERAAGPENRLAQETSPYLRQHADNPVDWHPWGAEAIEQARTLDKPILLWINDGLMAIFFVVVGLEIKRERVEGELRDPRRAALPAIAAVGGMLAPAAIFAVMNVGTPGVRGWGVPMATDIAMAVAVVKALGPPRVPSAMQVFLLALAIVDDIGAIVVIAVFYSEDAEPWFLGGAVAVVAVVIAMRKRGFRSRGVYVLAGVTLWLMLQRAGVHATVARHVGVVRRPTVIQSIAAGAENGADVAKIARRRARFVKLEIDQVRVARQQHSRFERLDSQVPPVPNARPAASSLCHHDAS